MSLDPKQLEKSIIVSCLWKGLQLSETILAKKQHGETLCTIPYWSQLVRALPTKKDTTVARHFNKCPKEKPSLFEGISISVLSFMHHPSDSIQSNRTRPRRETLDAEAMFYHPTGSKSHGLIPVFPSTHKVA